MREKLIVVAAALNPGVIVDPSTAGFRVMDFLRQNGQETTIPETGFQMQPNQFLIARTLEAVSLPLHLAARVEGRSSLARLGLSVHVTAPSVHAGFQGPLYLEMKTSAHSPLCCAGE